MNTSTDAPTVPHQPDAAAVDARESGPPHGGSSPVEPVQVDETTDAIAGAMIDLMRQYSAIKPRITGPDGDLSPIFLLSRLTLDGPSRAVELAAAMCWDPSTVSRLVASLVKAGLVERRADPEDGRASLLVPTAAGRAKVDEHRRRRGAAIAPIVAGWSSADRENLLVLVRRYSAGIAEHRESIISALTGAVLPIGSVAGSAAAPIDSAVIDNDGTVTDSTVTDSTVTDSTVTDSTVTDSTVTDSVVVDSTVTKSSEGSI